MSNNYFKTIFNLRNKRLCIDFEKNNSKLTFTSPRGIDANNIIIHDFSEDDQQFFEEMLSMRSRPLKFSKKIVENVYENITSDYTDIIITNVNIIKRLNALSKKLIEQDQIGKDE